MEVDGSDDFPFQLGDVSVPSFVWPWKSQHFSPLCDLSNPRWLARLQETRTHWRHVPKLRVSAHSAASLVTNVEIRWSSWSIGQPSDKNMYRIIYWYNMIYDIYIVIPFVWWECFGWASARSQNGLPEMWTCSQTLVQHQQKKIINHITTGVIAI